MKIVVHKFSVGDTEDPTLYAGGPLREWEHSEVGQWVMQHAKDVPVWRQHTDTTSYAYQFIVLADLSEEDITYFALKWGLIK
jgi:hypothetical protein